MSEVEKPTTELKAVADPKASVPKIDAAAEKAYAEAAAKVAAPPKPAPVPAPVPAPAKAVKAAPAAKTPAAPTKAATAEMAVEVKADAAKTVRKTATKTKTKTPAAKPVSAKKAETPAAAAKVDTSPFNPIIKLKDTIMATAQNTDIAATAKEMLADVQERAQTAFAKTGEMTAEATEFTKANVEAVVESGKIFFAGAQELMKDGVETGKAVLETVTEDAKKVAAIKSPTDLMQLQGELARRNFDAVVAYGSKRTEALVKLYSDAMAPISNRVSVAVEKVSKAA